jgi:hypothetical protein
MRPAERLLARQARHSSGRVDWEDIDIARSNFAFIIDPRYLFDGDMEKAFVAPLGALPAFTIMFNKPLFIGQCQMVTSDPSRFDNGAGAVITWIAADGGAVPPGVGIGPLAAPQTDRAAIAPPVWPAPMIGVQITMAAGLGAASNISEFIMENCLCVHATILMGPIAISVDDTPDEPLFVQDLQQMVNEEAGIVLTCPAAPAPQWVGAGTRIFDKDVTTGVTNAGIGTITITPHFPILIGRIAFYGSCTNVLVDVIDVAGGNHIIQAPIATANGWDSGNFTPIMARQIHIAEGTGPIAIQEVTVLKVVETKDTHSQRQPLQVEAEQQVVLDELDVVHSNAHSANIGVPTDITPTIDKDLTTFVISAAGAWGVAHVFKSPKLISRVSVAGLNMQAVAMFYTDLTGAVVVLIPQTAGPVDCLDSGNFSPVMATGVAVVGTAPAFSFAVVYEMVTLKAIETKSEAAEVVPELVEFAGQKVYWDQLDTQTGGAPSLKPYMLTRIPLDINADDDPATAGTLDATVVTTVAGAEAELIVAQFHEYSRDIRKVRNYARAMATVECGTNCRITRVGSRIGMRHVTDNAITWITVEKLVTLNVDGAALRHVCLEHQDWIRSVIPADWVLVWQVRVLGYRTAGAIAVPATLWHSRGTTECKLDSEIIVQATEVFV